MEQGRLPGLARIVRAVRTLADASLEGSEFRRICRGFGWQAEPPGYPGEEDAYLAFHLPQVDRWLHITLVNGAVNCAVLPLLFWEDFDAEFYDSEALYRRARLSFDRRYEKALQQTKKILGPPLRTWVQDDEDQHRKAVWQGRHSLLMLQQDDYDVQYGFDINFLIQPHQGPLPQLLGPLL